MRFFCYFCQKSVTTEVPSDTEIRALLVCPECLEGEKILIPFVDEGEPEQLELPFEETESN